jgi:4-amino-4-deoxy-L-arabinose transferase-like glycosyltransferase
MLVVVVGIVACLPSWFVMAWVVHLLSRKNNYSKRIKGYLTIICLLLILCPFGIVESHALTHLNYWPSMLPWLISYYVVAVAVIWFLQIKALEVNEVFFKS